MNASVVEAAICLVESMGADDRAKFDRALKFTTAASGRSARRVIGHASLPEDTSAELIRMQSDVTDSVWASQQARDAGDRLNAFIVALRSANWTLDEIASVVGTTRERVRQRELQGWRRPRAFDDLPPIPVPPMKPLPEPGPEPIPRPKLSTDVAARMLRLQAVAHKCRGNQGAGHPARDAAEELCVLMAELIQSGFRAGELAAILGVTRAAVCNRLKARGYSAAPPLEVVH